MISTCFQQALCNYFQEKFGQDQQKKAMIHWVPKSGTPLVFEVYQIYQLLHFLHSNLERVVPWHGCPTSTRNMEILCIHFLNSLFWDPRKWSTDRHNSFLDSTFVTSLYDRVRHWNRCIPMVPWFIYSFHCYKFHLKLRFDESMSILQGKG